ncbi:hypothetical protein NIES2101_26595 [Calothrix sp. HK-06]|nr:hypothetical protein NIES2101_26595 [Calothrix sp. HK-06]
MARYINSPDILEDILAVEGDYNVAHIQYEVEEAKQGRFIVINGANFEAKYYVQPSGEVRYSMSHGLSPEKAQKQGFGIAI